MNKQPLKLYMLLLGCKPKGRFTEQHDVFFAIGPNLKAIIPDINNFWADGGSIHIDAWREVTEVDGFKISIQPRVSAQSGKNAVQLFFLNLGGYKEGEFEEFHYKMLAIGKDKSEVIRRAKQTAFYKHTGFKGAASHIDDKYGVDVDDVYKIEDVLSEDTRNKYSIEISTDLSSKKDDWHLGYTMLSKVIAE